MCFPAFVGCPLGRRNTHSRTGKREAWDFIQGVASPARLLAYAEQNAEAAWIPIGEVEYDHHRIT